MPAEAEIRAALHDSASNFGSPNARACGRFQFRHHAELSRRCHLG
jgi:hypothetical protein